MSRRKPPRNRSGDYKVGKYRPPVESQFKKGQSGNPPGRRKGSKNRKTIVRAAERRLFPVVKGGRKLKMTATEIGMDHLQQAVARGDLKAFDQYFGILERYGDRNEVAASLRDLLAEDKNIMSNLLARMKRRKGHSNGDE
jgi:hypothetical protein